MRGVITSLLMGTALVSTAAHALELAASQPLPSTDPQGFSIDEQVRQTESDGLKPLQEKLEKQSKQEPLDREEAADQLEGSGSEPSGILDKLPSYENLARLKAKMNAQPRNLDHYFAYAQMAGHLGDYALAAEAFEQMLELAPSLDRVRLDLGTAYLRLGRFEEAKEQLEIVLAKELPEQVRTNVERVLANLDGELREHDFSGLVSAGFNWDANANSAPESESVVIQDIEIPLTGEQLEQRDLQFFASLGLNHTYRPRWAQSDNFARRWKSSANYYRAKQSSQEQINVEVLGFRTGPEFQSLKSGIRVNPAFSYNHIRLAGHTYLRTSALDTQLNIPISEQFSLFAEAKYENRDFENSPTVTVFELRQGSATQLRLSGQYIPTETDILGLSFTHRREHTQEEYFDNERLGGNFTYTRILPDGWFATGSLGIQQTDFEANDPLISARVREDLEYTGGLTLGYQIREGVTATLGYQYRNVDSNIRNFDYDNHRLSASISKQF